MAAVTDRFKRQAARVLEITNDLVQGWARCADCAARWLAVRPLGVTTLECPACHHLAGHPERRSSFADYDYDDG